MKKRLKNLTEWLRSKRGVALVEYAVIIVAITVVVIVALAGIGQQSSEAFSQLNSGLAALPD